MEKFGFSDDEAINLELLLTDRQPETPEEVDAVLRVAGFDPDEVARKFERIAQCALREVESTRRS